MSNPWSNLTPLPLTREFVSLLPDGTLEHQLAILPFDPLASTPDAHHPLVRTYAAWDVTMIGAGNGPEAADEELGEEMTATEIDSGSNRGADIVNDTVPDRNKQDADKIIPDSDDCNYMFDSDVDASAYFIELFKDLDMQDNATGVTASNSVCVDENIIETVNTLFGTSTPPCARRIRANSLNFPPPPPIRRIRRIGSVPLGDYERSVFEPCLHHEDLFAAFTPTSVSDGMDGVEFHI